VREVTDNADVGDGASALFGKTMNCDEAVHQLYHFLDGELTEERRVLISEHLTYCAPCGGAVEFEAELRVVIANHCKDRVPESLIRRIADAIDEESRLHDGGR
jgi:mycothiol system anti-sigma-R factor